MPKLNVAPKYLYSLSLIYVLTYILIYQPADFSKTDIIVAFYRPILKVA